MHYYTVKRINNKKVKIALLGGEHLKPWGGGGVEIVWEPLPYSKGGLNTNLKCFAPQKRTALQLSKSTFPSTLISSFVSVKQKHLHWIRFLPPLPWGNQGDVQG